MILEKSGLLKIMWLIPGGLRTTNNSIMENFTPPIVFKIPSVLYFSGKANVCKNFVYNKDSPNDNKTTFLKK